MPTKRKLRIMPDCHAGAGCTIGTTMTITNKITPNLVGVDIGCGMDTSQLGPDEIDLVELDKIINECIPHGFNTHKEKLPMFDYAQLKLGELRCRKYLKIERAEKSVGTLGGGNHFIEVGRGKRSGSLFLVIHSGSRGIGNDVAKYYQKLAISNAKSLGKEKLALIAKLKSEGRQKDIAQELKKMKAPHTNEALAYLEGSDFDDYMHDLRIMQEYASFNRQVIRNILWEKMHFAIVKSFETIHNYVDFERMILRKGAIRAERNEIVLIPINMRDGSILAEGKGNPDWNYSAPHGAGRTMSRTAARKTLELEDFSKQMKGIYSTSVCEGTLDEAPGAYKTMGEILSAIEPTATVIDIIIPIYNFKSH